jgi:rhamnulokinase
MADEHHFLALDLGAESGRGEIVTLAGGKVTMEEVHRFPSRNVRLAGTRYWDFPATFAEVLEAIRLCAERGVKLTSISVDTWGVDFGLLGRDGQLLGLPVHYRDARTDGIHEHAGRIMPIEEIFAATALHTMPINTLFQLHAMQRADSPVLEAADTFLMMPDLFAYFLTGEKACELSIAQTSQLVDTQCRWCKEIIGRFGLPERIFPRLVEPATVLGTMTSDVADQVGGYGDVPVVACAAHDTSAAVAAVPARGGNWAFCSCGTWSILGRLVDQPVATKECYDVGFTNEYTYGGWYLARNILGLWLVQELKRKWDRADDAWDYARMTDAAAKAASGPIVDVDDGRLLAPADMEETLLEMLRETHQGEPAGRGQLLRCVLESLALEYNWCVDTVGRLTGQRPEAFYMVGGGIHNRLLCQLTANACGMAVHAGADQCTALGNALGQALALGILKDRDEIRDVMRASSDIITYEPQDQSAWADRRDRYGNIQGRKTWG